MAGFVLRVGSWRISEKGLWWTVKPLPPKVGKCRGQGWHFSVWISQLFQSHEILKILGIFCAHTQWCFEAILYIAFFSARLPMPASHFVLKSVYAHRNSSGWGSTANDPGDTLSTHFTCPLSSCCYPAPAFSQLCYSLFLFSCCRSRSNIELLT